MEVALVFSIAAVAYTFSSFIAGKITDKLVTI